MPSRIAAVRRRLRRRATYLALAVLAACAPKGPAPDAPTAAATLEATKAALLDAFVRKDPVAIAGLYAEDAVVIEPNGTILTGRPAIEARIAALLPSVRGYSISSRRSELAGDLVYDQETFQLTLGTEGGEATTITGHQVVILKRVAEGTWKVVQSGSWAAPPAEMPAMPGMGH